jgi:hypothetical protein
LISITIGLELVKLLINCSRHKMGVVDQNLRKKLADWGLELKRCNNIIIIIGIAIAIGVRRVR